MFIYVFSQENKETRHQEWRPTYTVLGSAASRYYKILKTSNVLQEQITIRVLVYFLSANIKTYCFEKYFVFGDKKAPKAAVGSLLRVEAS